MQGLPHLDEDDARRDRHQIGLPEVGEHGQRRLKGAAVLIVGMGGLGCPAAMYLAAAGVGQIVLVDFDRVEISNLQRQVLYETSDAGRPKLQAAVARLAALNSRVEVEGIDAPFDASNARGLVDRVDVVIDGTDNFSTRFLVNDACVMAGRPNVFGSVLRFEGQVAVFAVAGGPCYRCLHPEPPPEGLIPNCAEGGVLGVVPGVIGSLQALEAIKLITGAGESLVGRMLLYDAWRMRIRQILVPRAVDCPVCGDVPTISELVAAAGDACAALPVEAEISVEELESWRGTGQRHLLVDVREPDEYAVAHIDGAVLIPLGVLDREAHRLSREAPVVVHCRTGRRSRRAAAILRRVGLDARSLSGGFEAWSSRDCAGDVAGRSGPLEPRSGGGVI
ncbi:MAG: molybdopterin-synthase adenylyltransferase MoeB [Vicinamibacterales bacterium]